MKTVCLIKRGALCLLLPVLLMLARPLLATPAIETWQTSNGARVLFVPSPGIPMLDIEITFDAGAARDDGHAGLAVLTNGLLAEGAGGKGAQQIAEAFESVGAQFGNDALRDMAQVSLRSLSEPRYLEPALAMFKTVLSQPDFPQKALARELQRMKVAVRAAEQSPGDIASRAFYRELYGSHPYASPPGGTLESLDKLDRDQVRAFYRRYYVARNATVAIVGAIDRNRAAKIAEQLLSALPAGEAAPALPPVKPLRKAKKVFIEYPSTQTHIYMGQPGIKRGDADYFTLYVANHPLGGSGFSSRLVNVIREKNGLAYSVYSYFSPMREAGPFMLGMQTRSEQAGKALKLLDDTLRDYLASGPGEDELKASKSNITGSFPLNLDSNSKLLGYLTMIGFYHLPTDYLDHFIERIDAVSKADIVDALHRRIDPDKMITVIVGKQEP